jgi:hypothetical protein
MNVDFDNLRRNIALSYNCLAETLTTPEQREAAADLCNDIAGLLALYGDGIKDLSEEIMLVDPFLEEDP